MNAFENLSTLNVNEHTEKKTAGGTTLTYLSWAWAWAETKKRYPDANYTIYKDPVTALPYVCDPATGYMVYTAVTIEGVTHEMWLPVMDGSNHAMKTEPYEIETKYRSIPVAPATMFDVNKTIMRCLTKNLAMFGLGLYIYAGEDIPEADEEPEPKKEEKKPAQKKAPAKQEVKPIICASCNKPIIPITGKSGNLITPEKLAKISMDKYGKNLCADCQQKLKASVTK